MRTLWLQFGGSAAVNDILGIPHLTYPLCYNIPWASWRLESNHLRLRRDTKGAAVFFDLVVEINRDLKNTGEPAASRAIEGFRYCLGISDNTFLDTVSSPTIRDRITCMYYSRFPEGYNNLSQLLTDSYEDLCKEDIDVAFDQAQISTKIDLNHKPEGVLAFLSGITTLNAGDLVSLGSFLCLQNFDLSNQRMILSGPRTEWSLIFNKEVLA